MRIENSYNGKIMSFGDIRDGSVFKKEDRYYIKSKNGVGVDLSDGSVINPDSDEKFVIVPGAKMTVR